MKRHALSFRALLERVLPLDALPPLDRERVRAALDGDDARRIERVALEALDRLTERGLFERLPDRLEPTDRVVRFQRLDTHEVIALRFASPPLPLGIVALPRSLATLSGQAPLERVRRLLRLDDALVESGGRLPSGTTELIGRLTAGAREMLDCEQALFFPAPHGDAAAPSYAPPPGEHELLARWSPDPAQGADYLLVAADAALVPELRGPAAHAHARSIASVRVRAIQASLDGVLEVRSAQPGFFTPERVSLLSLLAESFGSLADQAARLQRLVFHDALTGVSNSAFFRQALDNEVARAAREGKSMALVIADIDDFKRFNTVYGYEGGNAVLKQVAQIFKRAVRPFDTVARWGGEEFAVLLTPPLERDDAETIAERLRALVAEGEHAVTGLDALEHRVRVTVSIGVALYPEDARSATDLWLRANQALLLAKTPPKNQVVFWKAIPPA
ncbi:MAG: GGDEF domain-containing protein [Candidatus Eisenbacteria bacterium]